MTPRPCTRAEMIRERLSRFVSNSFRSRKDPKSKMLQLNVTIEIGNDNWMIVVEDGRMRSYLNGTAQELDENAKRAIRDLHQQTESGAVFSA